MHEVPECLNRRYEALKVLIEDITTAMPAFMGGSSACGAKGGGGGGARGGGCGGGGGGAGGVCSSSTMASLPSEEREVGSELMSDFWKILRDDPDCNLTKDVKQRMCLDTYTAKCRSAGSNKILNHIPSRSGSSSWTRVKEGQLERVKNISVTCTRDPSTRQPKKHDCSRNYPKNAKEVALRKVLGNLKEVASFEEKCSVRLSELVVAQKDLTKQINNLEAKEKKEVGLMKQADCMWASMEDCYKKKLAESQERYQDLQKQLKEVEASANKWRKNKNDLEFQMKNITKCSQEMIEKKIQKENDIKIMELEIEGFRKRIASNEKDIIAAKNSYTSKKNASDKRLEKVSQEMEKYQNKITLECRCKADKEKEGSSLVKEARDELQTICRALLQKKLENEDLQAEKEALTQEIGLLKNTYDTCAIRCAKREKNIAEETKRIDQEISGCTAKCVKCHKCTDSADVTGFCVDCPRCLIQRDCLNEGDQCRTDHTKDCVCTRIKKKFLDNVFENMYTVLESQVKTCPGKELADCILNCLKTSRNGKLDEKTRKILQEFVLKTVKKNLNLTIVGGAVKTRCEMEPDTYRQLMLCLKDVAVTKPVKEDKSTPAKKPPCSRWHTSNECNCPRGPKSCPCTKKAAKPPTYPGSCGQPETEVVDSSVNICPRVDSEAYGVDCGMLGLPGSVEWKREPCRGKSCSFSTNMRAAQCRLGPEVLADVRASRPKPPIATCISGGKAVKSCHTVIKHLKGDKKYNFNEGTKVNYQKTTKENPQLKLSLSDAVPTQAILKPISSLEKVISFTDEQQRKVLEELTKNNLDQNETKEQFLIAFKNENGQSNQQFTELTQTPSGKLAIELDEQTIKIVGEKSITDPYLFISIKTTTSGHVLVDLDTKENIIDKTHKVIVRRTSSGTKLLDIHKNMIRILNDTLSKKLKNAGLYKSIKLPSSPKRSESPIDTGTEVLMSNKDLPLKGSMGTTCSDSDLPLKGNTGPKITDNHLEHISSPILTEIYMKHKNNKELKCICPKSTSDSDSCKLTSDTGLMIKNKKKAVPACSIAEFNSPQELEEQLISSLKSSNSRSVDNCNYISEFNQLYKQGNANVAVEIQGENGVVQKLLAVVTNTESGAIAIYARGMSSLQEISFDGKESPVLLSKTVSGTYFVRIANNYQNINATLIKTPSEGIIVIPQSFQEKFRNGDEVEDFFKVKLSVMRNQILELPAVLKPTSSNNYLVVLDKEFEKSYKETLKEFFGDNLEGSVDLRTTSSGNYVLELGNEDESNLEKKNASLVKTSSGHIKVLVHGPDFESVDQRKLSISSNSSAQALGKINSNLPGSSREFHRQNLRKSKNLDSQASSKTQSLVKVKEKLQDGSFSDKLLSEPSIVIKKTPSGQYAILLNEESKTSLLNNLQSNYLTSNTDDTNGLVLIKQLDSEKIIINLNNKDEDKVHHGTLKVTSSGTFNAVVDEDVMKDLIEVSTNIEVSCTAVGKRSIHATQLIDSVHKAVPTTYQGNSDDCCCDPYTCVCANRPCDSTDGSNDKLAQLCPCVWKEASAGGVPIPSTSWDDSNPIVLEPSCNSVPSKKELESTERYFYWFDCCDPYNQLCYDGLSNKLLEKSELYQSHENREFEANSEEPAEQNACETWDALDYLPPQLPYFLKDVRYR